MHNEFSGSDGELDFYWTTSASAFPCIHISSGSHNFELTPTWCNMCKMGNTAI